MLKIIIKKDLYIICSMTYEKFCNYIIIYKLNNFFKFLSIFVAKFFFKIIYYIVLKYYYILEI